jgi:hypothetical protein
MSSKREMVLTVLALQGCFVAESESSIQRRIQMALSKAGCIIWRNETAGCNTGKVIHKAGDQVTLDRANFLSAGLCKGSADLIGIAPNGAFLAVEVKTAKGRTTKEQDNFLLAVNRAGGIGFVARGPEEAVQSLQSAL